MTRPGPGKIQTIAAIMLAVSFLLPVARYTEHVDADGRTVGFMHLFGASSEFKEVTSYAYFWQEMYWVVPLIFFLPLALTWLRSRLRGAVPCFVIEVVTPLIAVGLLLLLNAMVTAASMFLSRAAIGSYVALIAMAAFTLAAALRALVSARGWLRGTRDSPAEVAPN